MTRPSTASLPLLPARLDLIFCPGGEDQASRGMEDWCKDLVREAPGRLALVSGDPESQPFLPALTPKGLRDSLIHYHFVPLGREEDPFRELLWLLAEGDCLPERDRKEVGGRRNAVEALLFVSSHCPNCPHTVRALNTLAVTTRALCVHVLDVMLHPEAAQRHHVRSVPTLLVDRRVPFVGSLDPDRLLRFIESTDSSDLLREQVRELIRSGHVSEAARLLATGVDPSFLAAQFEGATFQDRLALLATFEEALEIETRCLDPLAEHLLPHLNAKQVAVRGDVAHLLGRIGHPVALSALERLCKDLDPDVAEAAKEAVEEITSRKG